MRVDIKAKKAVEWMSDKYRQVRSIAGNPDLLGVLAASDDPPTEGTRFAMGQALNVFQPDGTRSRLKICGVRCGGFSNVYTVVDLDEMRPYCLKESRATPGEEAGKNARLAIEAEISLLLGDCPYLVKTIAAYKVCGRLFLLSEYYPYTSLDIQLGSSPLPLESAVAYAIQICRGMSHARKVLPGFVHGDIKPANCLISGEGLIKLGDFGLSSATGIGRERPMNKWGHFGAVCTEPTAGRGGTVAYMAPELFHRGNIDRKPADIYSFGVTLFEMICGKRPFANPVKAELVRMHRSADLPLSLLIDRGTPSALVGLIDRCLSKSPTRRPASFDFIESILRRCYEERFGRAPLPEPQKADETVDVLRKALTLAELGKPSRAIAVIDDATAEFGDVAELLAAKTIALLNAGLVEAAYAASTAALRINANVLSVLVAHARVLIIRNRSVLAEDYLLRALELQPDNCVVLNLLAQVYLANNEAEEARLYLKRSLVIDRRQSEPYEHLARIELNNRNFKAACVLAKRSASIDPTRASTHKILAAIYSGQSQPVDAIKSFKLALGFGGDRRADRHRFVDMCLSLQGSSKKRGSLVRTLLSAALILQRAEFDRNCREKFVDAVISVLAESGFDPSILFFHDRALSKVADRIGPARAQRLYETLKHFTVSSNLRQLPHHCFYSLGRVFYHLDKIHECKFVFAEQLTRFGPNESSYYFLGACAEIERDFAVALKFYIKANRLMDCEDSRTGIGRVRSKLREQRDAPGKLL